MASFKALCLAGVASLVATATGYAADLPQPLPPPPPVYIPPPPVVFGGNWYLRGDVGVGIADLRTRDSNFDYPIPGLQYVTRSLDDSAFIDGGVGYRFNQYFRADITGEYRGSAQFKAIESFRGTGATGFDTYTGSIRSVVGLVNGYVDAGTWYGITPFVGAGVGVANLSVMNVTDMGASPFAGFGYAADHNQTNFAFALMAGLDFSVTQNLKLEFGYRYLDMGTATSGAIYCQNIPSNQCPHEVQHSRLNSNDIRLGFRYSFADYAPIGPAPVLVSRY